MVGSEDNDRDASRRRRIVEAGGADNASLLPDRYGISSLLLPELDNNIGHLKGSSVGSHDQLQHNDYSASEIMKGKDTSNNSELDNRVHVEPELQHSTASREPVHDSFANELKKVNVSEIMPIAQGKTSDEVQKLRNPKPSLFTAKEFNSCVIDSERTRVFCSVLIALLVVLSYVDYPLLGINIVNSKSIIAAKPMYMLLITDFTIMCRYLALERRRRIELPPEEDVKEEEEDGGRSWARAVHILERGLVAHQTIRAIFIDCSLYVVIIYCGLSLI